MGGKENNEKSREPCLFFFLFFFSLVIHSYIRSTTTAFHTISHQSHTIAYILDPYTIQLYAVK